MSREQLWVARSNVCFLWKQVNYVKRWVESCFDWLGEWHHCCFSILAVSGRQGGHFLHWTCCLLCWLSLLVLIRSGLRHGRILDPVPWAFGVCYTGMLVWLSFDRFHIMVSNLKWKRQQMRCPNLPRRKSWSLNSHHFKENQVSILQHFFPHACAMNIIESLIHACFMLVSCLFHACFMLVLQCEALQLLAKSVGEGAKQEGISSPEPLRMYVQYSGGQLPYYAQPAQYQPQYQPAYAGAVSPQPVQSVMQMPQMQQYPATYSGFSGGAYMASPAYGQPQLAQYGQPQPQAQPQPQYAQLQYQPQVQPQVQPLQSGMAEGAYGQVLAIALQSDSIHMRHQAPCVHGTRVPPHHDQSRDKGNML